MKKIFNRNVGGQDNKIYVLVIVLFAICFAIPSITYLFQNKTVLEFKDEFKFLMDESSRLYQTVIYGIILVGFVFSYGILMKDRNKIFKNTKQIFVLTFIVSAIFVLVIPFMSSDVFYYLGVGRLNAKYGQNPYYVTMKAYVEQEAPNLEQDTVLQKGYQNYWSGTTVVYGPIWTMICSTIAGLSFGNIDVGLWLFKIANLAVHLLNCYLIYKITNKKKLFILLYGLNPFVLLEGIGNVHNDMFVVCFILLAFFALLKKKNLVLSIFCLALATDIKYFAILLLPLFVIYFYREEKVSKRFLKCIQYGLLYAVFVALPYWLYIRDLQVFMGMNTQRGKVTKGIYFFIMQYFTNPENLHKLLADIVLVIFVVAYFYKSVKLLFQAEIKFSKEMKDLYWFMLAFLWLLISNFQPWYFMWLTPFMFWQNGKNIKLMVQMQILTLVADMVFLAYSEYYIYGVPFFVIFLVGTLVCMLQNKKEKIVYIRG